MRVASGEAPGSWECGARRKEREAGTSVRRCRVRACLRGVMVKVVSVMIRRGDGGVLVV
jgi:hypothetical protein